MSYQTLLSFYIVHESPITVSESGDFEVLPGVSMTADIVLINQPLEAFFPRNVQSDESD